MPVPCRLCRPFCMYARRMRWISRPLDKHHRHSLVPLLTKTIGGTCLAWQNVGACIPTCLKKQVLETLCIFATKCDQNAKGIIHVPNNTTHATLTRVNLPTRKALTLLVNTQLSKEQCVMPLHQVHCCMCVACVSRGNAWVVLSALVLMHVPCACVSQHNKSKAETLDWKRRDPRGVHK